MKRHARPVVTARARLVALLSAEAVSAVGSRMSLLAIPWLVLVTTGSPVRMGLVVGAETLAQVLSGVFATPLVNRLGLRRVSIGADLGSALTTGAVAALATYRDGFALLVVLVTICGAMRGVGDRSKHVMLKPVAEAAGAAMARITAVFDGIGRLATLLGASIGGVLIAWLGPPGAVWVDAASFAACAAAVFGLVRTPPAAEPDAAAPKEPYFAALRGGFRHLRHDRLLFGLILMFFVTNLFNQASAAVFIPLWVNEVLHSPVALGFVGGAFAAGAIGGNLAFTALATRLPRYATLTVAYLVGGSPRLLVLALSHRLPVVLVVSFVSGVAVAAVNPTIGALLYERVPAELQARVFGLTAAVAYGGIPLGGLVAAWAVGGLGLTGGLLLCGVAYFVATLTPVARYRSFRQMDNRPGTPALAQAART